MSSNAPSVGSAWQISLVLVGTWSLRCASLTLCPHMCSPEVHLRSYPLELIWPVGNWKMYSSMHNFVYLSTSELFWEGEVHGASWKLASQTRATGLGWHQVVASLMTRRPSTTLHSVFLMLRAFMKSSLWALPQMLISEYSNLRQIWRMMLRKLS